MWTKSHLQTVPTTIKVARKTDGAASVIKTASRSARAERWLHKRGHLHQVAPELLITAEF